MAAREVLPRDEGSPHPGGLGRGVSRVRRGGESPPARAGRIPRHPPRTALASEALSFAPRPHGRSFCAMKVSRARDKKDHVSRLSTDKEVNDVIEKLERA